jgi:peptidyl-prolyl cis-trans isomerase SurA
MKTYFSILVALIVVQFSFAQDASDTLLTIDGRQISKEEFLRIYNKNSSIAEDQKKSVDEYLDLFINYKLKVIEAENLGYDTMSSFIKEMEGYTKQLAKPYIENSGSLDSFTLQAYQRSLEEVNVSHIMLALDKNALPKDTVAVYNRIMELRNKLSKGESWEQVIKENSPSPDKEIGGDLGWFSVFRMVYPFESAAYNTPVGQVSMPVRTEYGYHLIKVNARRPNRGEVSAAHIMVNVPRNPSDVEIAAAQQKIQKAYDELLAGANWDETVKKYSEHKATVGSGGKLGWIKAGSAPDELLDMCYTLDTGAYSKPFQTKYGFHIVKTLAFKPVPTFDQVKDDYAKRVRQTGDIVQITRDQMFQKIKDESNFKFYEKNLDTLYALSDTSMWKGHWNPDVAKDLNSPIISIADKIYTQYDIAKSICASKFSNRNLTLPMLIRKKLLTYIEEELYKYELTQLPLKYPDYKNLLQEYHDGILLFNLTEDVVWKKAVDDSVGLQNFYNGLSQKYSWETRLALTKYTYKDNTLTSKLLKQAKKRVKSGLSAAELSKLLCPNDSLPCISFTELNYEKGDNAVADSMTWKKGAYLVSKDKDNTVLYFVDDVLPPQLKTLKDARGLYTADYQTYLEKQWIEQLRNKYVIKVNNQVLDQIRTELNTQNK